MKYLRIRSFGITFIPFFISHHFEMWKRAKICHSELLVSTFPTFQSRRTLFFGFVLGSYCRKRHDVTVTWPFEKIFHRTKQLKYKLILSINTMGCCGLACVVWLKSCEFSKRKSVLIVGNSSMMCLLQKFLNLTYLWTLFSMKLSELIGYFYYLWEANSIWKKSKPLKHLFDALETNSLSLMAMLKFLFLKFSVANMAGNRMQCKLQTMI